METDFSDTYRCYFQQDSSKFSIATQYRRITKYCFNSVQNQQFRKILVVHLFAYP